MADFWSEPASRAADRVPLYRRGTKKRHSFGEGQAMADLITP
jgi:hypothetical protein